MAHGEQRRFNRQARLMAWAMTMMPAAIAVALGDKKAARKWTFEHLLGTVPGYGEVDATD